MRNKDVFDGAKVALLLGDQLLVILRDDLPGLRYAGCWDLPGGGREGTETPLQCMQRECFEEVGLCIDAADVVRAGSFAGLRGAQWFFAARLPPERVGDIRFGSEGQRWALMLPQEFIQHSKGIPHLQDRVCLTVSESWWVAQESPPLP
ncbi:NUDIX domain protein [Sulfitobacter noctilucae]|uniref:NUDIX hydrolase n=1 Tax=Sulfitobacter noctilucae TaxID=1342302 RepID=UPI0004694077|nr:NUDIX hydrolase [Sulfitobacter noctilucae]KIN75183.1 NUDIX domain protein [Sulfitobacter noctilucae]